MKEVKQAVTSVRLKPAVLAQLRAEAVKLDRSASWVLGRIVAKHYE
jgi:predicted transcriptional regulator